MKNKSKHVLEFDKIIFEADIKTNFAHTSMLKNENIIDKTINKYITNWKITRLGKTDQAILRISTFELLMYDTPNIVAINEGIELAKKYSDVKISKMINGILDSILNNEVKDE